MDRQWTHTGWKASYILSYISPSRNFFFARFLHSPKRARRYLNLRHFFFSFLVPGYFTFHHRNYRLSVASTRRRTLAKSTTPSLLLSTKQNTIEKLLFLARRNIFRETKFRFVPQKISLSLSYVILQYYNKWKI